MEFQKTQVFNFEGAIRGMRNPKNSWNKSDSKYTLNKNYVIGDYVIGPNDIKLIKSLVKGGPEHRKFMRQIFICVDITAPRYWWQEYATYKIGTTENSQSTMHKLKDYPIILDMFEVEKNFDDFDEEFWYFSIKYYEYLREKYNKTKDYSYMRKLKQALGEGFLQTRTCTMNYENIYNMTNQREYHGLSEWSTDFINWVKKLPYSKEIFFNEEQ